MAAGGIAKKYLADRHGIRIRGYLSQLGPIKLQLKDWDAVNSNPFFSPDPNKISELENYMDALRKEGNSIGAAVSVVAEGVPPGLGEPIFDRLDADIAHAMMSINAVKGVEIGAGFACVEQKGTQHRDEITPQGFLSNHAGGTLGGISSGEPVLFRVAFKPVATIGRSQQTVDFDGKPVVLEAKGRHDPCVVPRAVPIVESMAALVLLDLALIKKVRGA